MLLVERSKDLILRNLPGCDELCQTIDEYRRHQLLCAEYDTLSKGQDQKLVEDLERQNREMEERIRELLRRRMEGEPRVK